MDFRKNQINAKIIALKIKLNNADYISSKLAEAIAEYLVTDNGDKSKLVSIYNEYQEVIKNKQTWRNEINALEEELGILKGE